jgi:hypothetical protein
MKFFMVAAASPTEEQRNAITFLFKGNEAVGFWHWTPDFWIVTTSNDSYNSVHIQNAIRDTVPGLYFAVFAVNPVPDDWAMWADVRWGDWVKQHWPSTTK